MEESQANEDDERSSMALEWRERRIAHKLTTSLQ